MSLPIVLRPEARTEFDQAADWYEQQRPGLGTDFIVKVNEVLDRIAVTPELHSAVYRDVRRAVVARYPYSVLYRVEATQVLVVAVFHTRRDPAVWKSRV